MPRGHGTVASEGTDTMHAGADRLRPDWSTLPLLVRARVVDEIGGRFLRDEPQHSGFSAAYAGVVTTTKGTAFVKAASGDGHPDSLHFLRTEIRVLGLLPPGIGPELRAAIDVDAGAALVLEAIDGRHPGEPWSEDDLHAIAAALGTLATTRAPEELPEAADTMTPGFTRWAEIAADDHLTSDLPAEVRLHMPRLLELEEGFREAVRGDMLVHDDIRADNILIEEGRARLLDWPHARRGAAWMDLPALLPSIQASGGPSCAELWPLFEEHGAPPVHSLLPVISGFASYLWFAQAQPEPPELPGLRAFQRAQAIPALRWLQGLLSQTRDRTEPR